MSILLLGLIASELGFATDRSNSNIVNGSQSKSMRFASISIVALTNKAVMSYNINTWVSWVIIDYECCVYVLVKIESTLCYQSKYSLENVTDWVTENCSLVNESY